MNILVLCGGESGEREVSLRSGARVCEALRERGHVVELVDARGDGPCEELLAKCRMADAVFLCFHGGDGEDGHWQAALERGGVFHYTGSGPAASFLAMDKPRAKARVQEADVPVADDVCWRAEKGLPPIEMPFVAKPARGGSSVGLCVIRKGEDWEEVAEGEEMLCEHYLSGREYSVGVLAGKALPPVEIIPDGGIYDYAHKYMPNITKEVCPAPLPPTRLAHLQDLALICFSALGLRDFARVDFKEDAQGRVHFLEANTLPGMTKTSLLPLAASCAGLDFSSLCEQMAMPAAQRRVAGLDK